MVHHNRTGSNDRVMSDIDTLEYHRARTDPRIATDSDRLGPSKSVRPVGIVQLQGMKSESMIRASAMPASSST